MIPASITQKPKYANLTKEQLQIAELIVETNLPAMSRKIERLVNNGVPYCTYKNWYMNNVREYKDYIDELITQKFKSKRGQILNRTASLALIPTNAADRRMCLEMTGDLNKDKDKQAQVVNIQIVIGANIAIPDETHIPDSAYNSANGARSMVETNRCTDIADVDAMNAIDSNGNNND